MALLPPSQARSMRGPSRRAGKADYLVKPKTTLENVANQRFAPRIWLHFLGDQQLSEGSPRPSN